MKINGVIYLAAPYSSPDPLVEWTRYKTVCRAAAKLMAAGVAVFSPLENSIPAVQLGKLDLDHAGFMKIDKAILARCDELLVLALDGWRESKGVNEELAEAARLRMPYYLVREREIDRLPALSKNSVLYKRSRILPYRE